MEKQSIELSMLRQKVDELEMQARTVSRRASLAVQPSSESNEYVQWYFCCGCVWASSKVSPLSLLQPTTTTSKVAS